MPDSVASKIAIKRNTYLAAHTNYYVKVLVNILELFVLATYLLLFGGNDDRGECKA